MRRKLFSMLALLLMAVTSATVFTACSDDDDNKGNDIKNTETSERTIFQQHVKANLKAVAENLNFGSWEVANTLNQDFNVNVLNNPAFDQTLHQILQQQIQAGVQPASEAVAALGYQYQSIVDLSQLHYRFTLKADKSGFDMVPVDNFELVHTTDGVTSKLSIDMSGDSKKMLSRRLTQPDKSLAVILLVPAKIEFAISTTALTGSETEVFKGELNNDIRTASELMDITKDDWNVSGSLSSSIPATTTKADQMQVTFNLTKDPTTKKFTNQFSFVHNGRNIVEIDAINTHQGNLIALLAQLPTLIETGQVQDDMMDSSLLSLLLATVMGNSVDQLKLTLADDLVGDIKISDVGQAAAVLAQAKAARRNYASQTDIDVYTQQLNQIVSGSLECKGLNQQIPMTLQTTALGVDYVAMPSLKFADEDTFVPLTDLLDKEGMAYALNIVDHSIAPARETIVSVRQLLVVLRKLLATETAND